MRLLAEYGDICAMITSDLLIRQLDWRLAATILRFAGLRRSGPQTTAEVRLLVTQAELADAANSSRKTAGTILRTLAATGARSSSITPVFESSSMSSQNRLGTTASSTGRHG
jgi:hypothetical protein